MADRAEHVLLGLRLKIELPAAAGLFSRHLGLTCVFSRDSVCVCVCERERRKRKKGETKREKKPTSVMLSELGSSG